ncbi:hypothetical protein [uncultured Thiothrix sp.]|uniref:antibiotic biosynthesis monooxygenase family protein n=1 Tax=uncultured Thiothrix sp. TaxID=223185 RepID=UPI00261F9DE3|nr:hypothetical protein [uncultured Thiothrix sp.]
MYTATFTFIAKEFDAEFYELDNKIAAAAKVIPGYLGEEAWENPQTGKISTVYYWESLEALQQLINDPNHILAKQASSRWLEKYYVTISQVLKSYGNSEINFATKE